MAKVQAQILGSWVVDPSGQKSMKLSRDKYVKVTMTDLTKPLGVNIPPEPNLLLMGVECEPATLKAIAGDLQYFVWIGPKQAENATPSAANFDRLCAYLARSGVSKTKIKAVIGGSVKKRSRGQIVRVLNGWLKTLPKAGTKPGSLRYQSTPSKIAFAKRDPG